MSIELADMLRALKTERAQVNQKLTKLDKAIAVLRGLSATNSKLSGQPKRRTMSAAARRKIAKAQKLRWAKARKAQASKD